MAERIFEGWNQYAEMVDAFDLAVADGNCLLDPAEDGLAQRVALDAILAAARAS